MKSENMQSKGEVIIYSGQCPGYVRGYRLFAVLNRVEGNFRSTYPCFHATGKCRSDPLSFEPRAIEKHRGSYLDRSKDKKVQLEVKFEQETVWLTQKQIAGLFGTQRPAITKHLHNIFNSKELQENSVCSFLEHTAKDGKVYSTKFYNLDAIISVGYRVNSPRATWSATDLILKPMVLVKKREEILVRYA